MNSSFSKCSFTINIKEANSQINTKVTNQDIDKYLSISSALLNYQPITNMSLYQTVACML